MGSYIADPIFSVSIIGAGPAGFALAAELQAGGTDVLIYSHPSHTRHAADVQSKGCLTVNGILNGSVDLRVTSDMGETLQFSDMIILTVPSTGQETILDELKRFKGQLQQHTLVAIPGNLISLVKDADLELACILETNLSPYSCRMEDGRLLVLGKKKIIYIAALHHYQLTPAIFQKIQAIFPTTLKWCNSVVEVSLANINGVFHPLMMLMNTGRIEDTGGDFMIYRDGLTPSVARAMAEIDRVRIQIGDTLGLDVRPAVEVSNECYAADFADLVDLARNSRPHKDLRAPVDLWHRNISEDVPDLLVCWHDLGERLGLDVSPLKAVIFLAEMATGVDYMKSGRNLNRLHLGDETKEELLAKFHPCFCKLRN